MQPSPNCIAYIRGIKYQLAQTYTVQTPIVGVTIIHDYFVLREDGLLTVFKGYAWNGADFPAMDSKSAMRGSLVHDVFCQAMRLGLLDVSYQRAVHDLLREHCIEDGMWKWRANLWHRAVIAANGGHPDQGPDRPIQYAPKRCAPRPLIDQMDV